jgi:hypothetical protein
VTEVDLADVRGHVEPDEGEPGSGGSSRESMPPRWWMIWTPTPRGTMIVMLPHPV